MTSPRYLNMPTALSLVGALFHPSVQFQQGTSAATVNYAYLLNIANLFGQNTDAEISISQCNDSTTITEATSQIIAHSLLSISGTEQSKVETTFKKLSKQWKEETEGYSSAGSMSMHPAYLEIIGYGEQMIPYILRDLEASGPNHWFIALKILAHHSPVKPEDAGNIGKMTEAWLEWGRANGKL